MRLLSAAMPVEWAIGGGLGAHRRENRYVKCRYALWNAI